MQHRGVSVLMLGLLVGFLLGSVAMFTVKDITQDAPPDVSLWYADFKRIDLQGNETLIPYTCIGVNSIGAQHCFPTPDIWPQTE